MKKIMNKKHLLLVFIVIVFVAVGIGESFFTERKESVIIKKEKTSSRVFQIPT
jgi:hypothetical protein